MADFTEIYTGTPTVNQAATNFTISAINGSKSGTAVISIRIKDKLCGDGVVDQGEACDDSNLANGDGCSSLCAIE
ncbi:MAG: hypothetical protein H7A25_23315 [Leptospiraceae bacterium]|nr:hypothetical protein [Leptospiraceae bacterium]